MSYVFFFFFKQKTAYELRISDWSSDVCSSDLVLLFVSGSGAREAYAYRAGLVPARISGTITVPGGFPIILTPITATLLHGSIAHLGFNMVMFYYLGRMVEGVLGSGRLLILYVAGAYAAAFAEYLVSPESTVPVIGASGAVSAVLGAYAIYFGNRTAPKTGRAHG